jgi:hypothetical protein
MKTTLNFPDDIISDAKIRAVRENTTLTDIIVQGLEMRLKKGHKPGRLPVSSASGGLVPGAEWERLTKDGPGNEDFR